MTFFLFTSIGLCLSFILLYNRKKKWATDKNRWIISGGTFLVGLIGYLIKGLNATAFGLHFLFIPFVFNCFDRLFKFISIRRSGRDFYLYLRYSEEIDDKIFADNPHINGFDKFFSIALLFIIIGLIMFGVMIFRLYKIGHL